MAGFTRVPGLIPGICEQDLRRRFSAWELAASAVVPTEEILRHTRIPWPMAVGLRSGRLRILRYELVNAAV